MKTITLDLTDCKTLDELHERIRIAFDFDKGYGANWDAFGDLMWSECDADKAIITGEKNLPKNLEKHIVLMHKVLQDTISFREKYNFNAFSYEIID